MSQKFLTNVSVIETAASSDTDKFVVLDSGVLKYRTGTQVRSDIGAGTGSMSSWIIKEGNGTESTSVTNGETFTIAQGTGIQSEMTSTSSGGTITITNTDRGSSQNIFKNFAVSGQSTVVADGNNDTLTLVAGSNVSITTNATNDSITITATDTNTNNYLSSASFNTGNGILTLNRNGLSAVTVDLDGRYNQIIGTDSDINTSGYSIIDNLYMTDGVITSFGSRNLLNVHIEDTRAAEKTPNDYLDKALSLDFTDEFGSLGSWWSGITMKGWSDNYQAWQLISGSDTSADNNLYFRTGIGTSWGTMYEVYHTGNLPTIPTVNNNSITIGAGTNLNGGGTFTLNQNFNETINVNLDSSIALTSVQYGSGVTLSESSDRADLLYINSSTSSWGGLQIGNTSNEFIFSLMGDGNVGGIYDDQNSDWLIQWTENSSVRLYYNASQRLNTSSTGVTVSGNVEAKSSSSKTKAIINNTEGYTTQLELQQNNTAQWSLGQTSPMESDGRFSISQGGTLGTNEFLKITSSGGVKAKFGGSSSVNELDDYEEGTYNISFKLGYSGSSYTATSTNFGSTVSNQCKYVKIGRVVNIFIRFLFNNRPSAWASSSTILFLNNLPFTPVQGTIGGNFSFGFNDNLSSSEQVLWYGGGGHFGQNYGQTADLISLSPQGRYTSSFYSYWGDSNSLKANDFPTADPGNANGMVGQITYYTNS